MVIRKRKKNALSAEQWECEYLYLCEGEERVGLWEVGAGHQVSWCGRRAGR